MYYWRWQCLKVKYYKQSLQLTGVDEWWRQCPLHNAWLNDPIFRDSISRVHTKYIYILVTLSLPSRFKPLKLYLYTESFSARNRSQLFPRFFEIHRSTPSAQQSPSPQPPPLFQAQRRRNKITASKTKIFFHS